MKRKKVLALLVACLFALGCFAGPAFAKAWDDSFVPPGLAKKDPAFSADTDGDEDENGETVTKHVYHPSLKGLMRAYENKFRNRASENARAVIGQLIEARGGTVPEDVHAVERIVCGQAQRIITDPELRAAISAYLEDLLAELDSLESGELRPQDKAKLIRSLTKAMTRIQERERAENHLRKALELCPKDLEAYQELRELLTALGDTSLKVFVRGKELTFDVPPLVRDNRTLIPFRDLAEVLDGTVVWNPGDQTITFTRNDVVIVLEVGSSTALVNGEEVTLDVPPTIISGRTLVPLRFVAEELGVDVDYLPNLVIVTDMDE